MFYGDKIFTRFDFVTLHLIIMQAANQMNQGTSRNALYTLIWIAVCDYLLLVIAKRMFHIECELYILAQSIGLVVCKV